MFRTLTWSFFFSLALSAFGCAGGTVVGELDSGTSDTEVDGGVDSGPEDSGILEDTGVDSGPAPVVCGDFSCDMAGGEDCMNCPLDCGDCPTCDMAPTCTGAVAAPVGTTEIEGFSNLSDGSYRDNYNSGTGLGVAASETDCADPQVRLRVRQIRTGRRHPLVGRNEAVYCVITAEDGAHSEVLAIGPDSIEVGWTTTDRTTINLTLAESVFWGQADLYRSINNVLVTYECYLTTDQSRARSVLEGLADRAGDAAEHADGYGWVFGTVSVLGGIIGSSLGDAEDRILNVQQLISADSLLTLTNGHRWTIGNRRRNGIGTDIEEIDVDIESWGCADVRETLN